MIRSIYTKRNDTGCVRAINTISEAEHILRGGCNAEGKYEEEFNDFKAFIKSYGAEHPFVLAILFMAIKNSKSMESEMLHLSFNEWKKEKLNELG